MGKFREWEQVCPVVSLIVAKDSEKLLNFLIDLFCFSIHLRVKDSGESLANFKFFPCFPHYLGCKLEAFVGDDLLG